MKVIYRVCPTLSVHESPYFTRDKKKLVEMCFRSLLGACDIPIELVVVADKCDEYKPIFNVLHPMLDKVEWVHPVKTGNFWTYKEQLQIARDLDDQKVLLLEDDYLWRPNTMKTLSEAVECLGFVFPYDHPGHFLEDRFNRFKMMTMVGNNTYRKCPSNTLTFATTSGFINTYYDILTSYGTCDHEMFTRISETEGIWCPAYSFATHCVSGLLAPNVNWRELANVYASEIK